MLGLGTLTERFWMHFKDLYWSRFNFAKIMEYAYSTCVYGN